MKIVLLSGSTVGSKTKTMMKTIEQKIQTNYSDVELTFLNLKELTIQFSDGRNFLDYDGDTGFVTRSIMDADIILIGSPTFQASIPGTLKNIFDLLPQNAFQGKLLVWQ